MPVKPTNLFLANRCFLYVKTTLAVCKRCHKEAPKNLNTTHQCEHRLLRTVLANFCFPILSQKELFKLVIKSPV